MNTRAHVNPGPTARDVSAAMLEHYLSAITVGWFDRNELPPDDASAYAPLVDEIRKEVRRHGDEEAFRLGVAYLLTAPDVDLGWYGGSRYGFDADEMREILTFIWRTLYPGAPLPTVPPVGVRLSAEPLVEDWWVRVGDMARVEPGDTLRVLAARHGLTLDELLARNAYYARRYRPDQHINPDDNLIRLRP